MEPRCCTSANVLSQGLCGGGAGSGPVARGWATRAWRICAGFAAIKPRARSDLGLADGTPWPDGQTLAWPSLCSRAAESYRSEHGIEPNLDVPTCALLPGDSAWHCCLNDLDPPPDGLYVEGDRSLPPHLNARTALAVVGTRSASDHGLVMAEGLGRALAEAGWPILSGLAKGIDAAAHRGCLVRNDAPIAVLGTALDRVYPAHHRSSQQ